MCFLSQTSFVDKNLNGLIAGLFAGLTYTIFPNIQILIMGITTMFQVYTLSETYVDNFVKQKLIFSFFIHTCAEN